MSRNWNCDEKTGAEFAFAATPHAIPHWHSAFTFTAVYWCSVRTVNCFRLRQLHSMVVVWECMPCWVMLRLNPPLIQYNVELNCITECCFGIVYNIELESRRKQFFSLTICLISKGLLFFIHRVYKKNATSEFPKKITLQFLSIKDFRHLGIEIELLIDHITVVVH